MEQREKEGDKPSFLLYDPTTLSSETASVCRMGLHCHGETNANATDRPKLAKNSGKLSTPRISSPLVLWIRVPSVTTVAIPSPHPLTTNPMRDEISVHVQICGLCRTMVQHRFRRVKNVMAP